MSRAIFSPTCPHPQERRPATRPRWQQGLWEMLWQDGLGWILVQAAGVTVLLASLAMPLAIFVGLAIAVGRLYGPRFLRPPLGWYVEVVRGTPLVLQLYVIFFILPSWGLAIPAFWAARLACAELFGV